MSRELEFMFQTDLNRFWGAVTNEDDRQRISAAGGTLHDCALCEIVRYGVHNKSEMVAPLIQFYRRYIAQMPEEHCSALLTHVVGFIENTETVKANALFPFITEDARLKIASSAVIDYVSLGELVNNDPMSRVKNYRYDRRRSCGKRGGCIRGFAAHWRWSGLPTHPAPT